MHLRTCLSLLIVVISFSTGFAHKIYSEDDPEGSTSAPGWDYEKNYDVADSGYNKKNYGYGKNSYKNDDDDYGYGKNSYKNDDDDYGYGKNSYKNDDDDYGYGKNSYKDDDDDGYDSDSSNYAPSRQKREPDEYGNMNIYFREPSYSGKSKKPKRIRFPVHRFKKGHFPRLPPLISFLPWLPIFADKLTKQTIIFSPTGGLYIIPPVINMYGQMFSIAQLIASGYCSLVSSGVPPPPAVNVAPLVAPGAVTGPGIPPPNKATGGFNGGVQTQFSSFPKTNYGSKGGY